MSMLLSKSKFLSGRQCARRLWLAAHGRAEPALEPEDVWEIREVEGAAVEAQAETLFPGFVRIAPAPEDDEVEPEPLSLQEGRKATEYALVQGRPILQAHLIADGLLSICDVLEPRGDAWFVWEVKASTEVKPIFEWDLAFQVEVARRAGLTVEGAGVVLLDPEYVRGEALDPKALLQRIDLTENVFAHAAEMLAEIEAQCALMASESVPEVRPSSHCKGYRGDAEGRRPSACGHLDASGYCGSRLPDNWAGRLPNLSGKKAAHVKSLADPRLELLDPNDSRRNWTKHQRWAIEAARTGEPVADHDALRAHLDRLEWPVAYVDFEFDPGMAVPRFPGTRPYTRIPFQWALCVQPEPGAPLEPTRSFLHLGDDDPRADFTRTLFDALPATGSIAVFSKAAEITVLRQLAGVSPDVTAAQINAAIARVYDVLELLRAGYYHPVQQGSYSIKKAAPALAGQGYEDLAIQNGMSAVVQRTRAQALEPGSPEFQTIQADLEHYCARDTELMHKILESVRAILAGSSS